MKWIELDFQVSCVYRYLHFLAKIENENASIFHFSLKIYNGPSLAKLELPLGE